MSGNLKICARITIFWLGGKRSLTLVLLHTLCRYILVGVPASERHIVHLVWSVGMDGVPCLEAPPTYPECSGENLHCSCTLFEGISTTRRSTSDTPSIIFLNVKGSQYAIGMNEQIIDHLFLNMPEVRQLSEDFKKRKIMMSRTADVIQGGYYEEYWKSIYFILLYNYHAAIRNFALSDQEWFGRNDCDQETKSHAAHGRCLGDIPLRTSKKSQKQLVGTSRGWLSRAGWQRSCPPFTSSF